MQNLSTKTVNKISGKHIYKENLVIATTFLKHDEDRITVIQGGENTNIEIYQNGNCLFVGDKYELFDILKSNSK